MVGLDWLNIRTGGINGDGIFHCLVMEKALIWHLEVITLYKIETSD